MSPARDRLVSALAPRVAYAYILLLRATVRLQHHNREVLQQIGPEPLRSYLQGIVAEQLKVATQSTERRR